MDGAAAQPDWQHLQSLLLSRSAVARGEAPVAAVGRGSRREMARRALEEAIRSDLTEQARRRREDFDRALQAIVSRVASRPAPPPPAPMPAVPVAPRRAARTMPAPAAGSAQAPAKPRRAAAAAPAGTPVAAPAGGTPGVPARPRARPRSKVPAPLPEFWSPGLVLGFRMWEVRGRLLGAWKPWSEPEMEARCLPARKGADHGEVPHTDGRCGWPPCGIYCFKEPEQLLAAFGLPSGSARVMLGLVTLTGKVVEHKNGYRARKARVLAAVVVGRGRLVRVEGDALLRRLFAQPEAAIEELASIDPAVVEEITDPVRLAEAAVSYLRLGRDFRLSAG